MLGILSQPKPQTADAAIYTLCDRISNSLLIEDRKAAILALRGLAHENRELVASNGLQGLLDVLVKDSHDPESAKATLETLLILFNTDTRRKTRNKKYISPLLQRDWRETASQPSETIINDISLWLTDRLLHNQEALSRILELSTTKNDAFTAVYALQLVSVMVANRPIETKQALLSSAGIPPLVSALSSVQDMVRDEALLLLNALTIDQLDVQKLVAFEGGFDKAFAILKDGGGVIFGGRFAEDCLNLIANLLEYNTSNQKLFTQSGYVRNWGEVLQSIIDAQAENSPIREQAIANIEAALSIGQLLCVPGAEETREHQKILHENDCLTLTLQIAFGPNSPPPVRVSALITVSALVDNNDELQDDLLSMDVPYYDLTMRKVVLIEPRTVSVSQALLNWAVNLSALHLFDLRSASLLCLSSAFSENSHAKHAFVKEQIEKYHVISKAAFEEPSTNGGTEATNDAELANNTGDSSQDANLIEVLAEFNEENRLNPFRIWFASAITMRLFINAPEIKDDLRKVKIGDESMGMEVHGLIQAIAGELQRSLQDKEPTVALGYLQLLAVWTYDDVDAVDELTGESSVIQALLAHQTSNALVESLAVIVLGISYAFCTKQSSLPREQFHRLLTQSLGRDQYRLLIRRFRQSSTFQNFDENDMFGAARGSNGSPPVYLDAAFVGLMKDTISYIARAIDANPDIEPSSRITFEMLDEAKHSLHLRTNELRIAEEKLATITKLHKEVEQKYTSTLTDANEHKTLLQFNESELKKVTEELEELREKVSVLESDLSAAKQEIEAKVSALAKIETAHSKQSEELESIKSAKVKAEEGVNNLTRELFQLQRAKESLEKDKAKLESEVSKLKPRLEKTLKGEAEARKKQQELQAELKSSLKQLDDNKSINEKLVAKLRDTAADLKQREEEEEELKTKLSKLKLESESRENEFITLKNRESSIRKSYEIAKDDLQKLKEAEKRNSNLEHRLSEIDSLKKLSDELKEKLAASSSEAEKSASRAKELEAALEQANSASKSALADSSGKIESLQSSNDKLKDVNSKLVAQISELNKKVKAMEEKKKDGETKAKDSDNSAADELREQLSEKSAALDELLVLLDDLTEKKSKYKSRLRDMGQDVSDSEEEEDDEDDDDGE